uniref:PHYA n=1 Tax=Pichia kudriavzevii TaxID=4909 RepID=A0A2U9N715_PICKU|nr:PHYA [Pichia kudriavzevii]
MQKLLLLATSITTISALPIGIDTPVANVTLSEDLFPTDIGFLGKTATADAPFLAETNGAAITYGVPTSSYTLPQPIETAIQARDHRNGDQNIYELFGSLSPYYVSDGWGVYDYGLPKQCSINQVHVLSRHGSRYPTSPNSLSKLLSHKNYTVSGELEFLNNWKYLQGSGILTKLGNQQLFDKGVRTFFRYGQLQDWNEDAMKIVAFGDYH